MSKLSIVSHKSTAMTGMQYPSQRFRKCVWGIQDARDMNELDTTPFFPILDSKVLDIDMSRTFSRNWRVDNVNGRCIIFIDRSWSFARETKLKKNWSQIKGNFGTWYCSKKLCFSRADSSDRLCFGTVDNGTTTIGEDKTSGRLLFALVVGVGGIDKGHQLGFTESQAYGLVLLTILFNFLTL